MKSMIGRACALLFVTVLSKTSVGVAQDVTELPVLADQYQDWVHRCVELEEGARCEINQIVRVEYEGTIANVLSVSVSPAEDETGQVEWAMIVLTPLDVYLPAEFGLVVGTREPFMTEYRNCTREGCWVVVPLSAQRVNAFKAGADATAAMQLMSGQTVRIVFSLMGFTAAFDALEAGEVPLTELIPGTPASEGGATDE